MCVERGFYTFTAYELLQTGPLYHMDTALCSWADPTGSGRRLGHTYRPRSLRGLHGDGASSWSPQRPFIGVFGERAAWLMMTEHGPTSWAPNIDNEQGLRCWTHLVGDGIDARTWSNTPSSSSHAEGIVLDCGHRTATRRIEECTIVDNCSFNVIGGIVSTRACQAQPAGLDVAAARRGTGGFIPGPYGPARPTLAAC